MMNIEIKVLNKDFYHAGFNSMPNEDLEPYYNLPGYATSGSAGIDLVCTKDVQIYPGETIMIPTGLAVWVGGLTKDCVNSSNPHLKWLPSYLKPAAIVLPRSGLGHKQGLVLGNTVGLIDQDYQGEVKVSCHNRNTVRNLPRYSDAPINISAGDRFAQLVIIPVIKAQWEVVTKFSCDTGRGDGGFGSTDNV